MRGSVYAYVAAWLLLAYRRRQRRRRPSYSLPTLPNPLPNVNVPNNARVAGCCMLVTHLPKAEGVDHSGNPGVFPGGRPSSHQIS